MFLGVEKREKYVKMATVQSEAEHPSDNKLLNGSHAGNIPERQCASVAAADCDAEVCAQGSDAKDKKTTAPAVPSSPATENASPHGAALSPCNKDASGMSRAWESAEDKSNTDMLLQNNNAESGAHRLHNASVIGKEHDIEETADKPSENVSKHSKIDGCEEHPAEQEQQSANISEEPKSHSESTEAMTEDTGDKPTENVSKDPTHDGGEEHPAEHDQESTDVSEEPESHREATEATTEDTGNKPTEIVSKDSKLDEGEKHTEEQDLELSIVSEEPKSHNEVTGSTEAMTEDTGDPESVEKVKDNTYGDEESKSDETGIVVKRRKSRLECKECGKKFTRRETYNLHRHFHMHQDEQATLVCKECGITFEHRSDLIKHRSIHKENSQPTVSHSKHLKRTYREQKKYVCEHCGMCFSTMMRLRIHVCEQNVDKPFRCPLCRKEFQYRVSINTHMQSHSLDSPYRCRECNKGFQSVETLHIHQRSHSALKPYECPDCNMVFRHRYVMEDHRRRHIEEIAHPCKVCGKNFKYSSLLQQHKFLHTGRKPYHCSYCGKKFAFAQNMRAHCREHRKISANAEEHTANHDESLEEQVGKENKNIEPQRNCPLCPQIFYNASDLRAHMLIHEAEYERMSNGKRYDKVYSCQYCPLNFQTESLLQSHSQTHMPNFINTTHITNQVKAVLEKQDVIMDETGIDNVPGLDDQMENKSFRCQECGKTFRYRSVLELHMRIHNKGYQCQVCKKSFRFSSYLQQHSIIHTGKKPYKCPDCGKDFAFHHNMKTHQRLHQQKPFRCTQCRKGYSEESQLQRHMLSHTGEKPYKCHLCDKSFALAYLLRDHLNTHTGERPHRCQECHKSFPWLSSLLVHQKIHARKRQGQKSDGYPQSVHSQRGRASTGRRGRPRLDRYSERSPPLPNVASYDTNRHDHMQMRSQHLQARTDSRQVQLQQEWQLQMTSSSEELLHSQKPTGILEAQQTNVVQMQWQGSQRAVHQQQLSQANVPISAQPNHYSQMSTSEAEQKARHPSIWISTPNSTLQKISSDSHQPQSRQPVQDPQLFSNSSEDGRAVVDASTKNESEKLTHNLQMPTSSGLGKTDIGQTGGVVLATGASSLQNTSTWGLKTSLETATTVSLQEIPGDALEKQHNRLIQHLPQIQVPQLLQQQLHQPPLQTQTQIPPTWVNATPPNQMAPVNIQYSAARFPLGERPPVWAFQAAPVVSQTLVNGPVQQGHIRVQQHVTLISGQRIPLSQPASFISPPFPPAALNLSAPHPIHSVGGQLPGPLPQGIFFASQGTINEMPLIPQVTNLSQLTPQPEQHKMANKMPFAPDHLFQCMICGCSVPGELELQMHYMQHAQRDV